MLTLDGSGLLQQVLENSVSGSGRLPPCNFTAPALVGKAEVGVTVSAQPGAWAGLPVPEIRTTLLVDGVARASPYLIAPEDDGKEIVVTDVATNGAGEATVSSPRISILHPKPRALHVPENISISTEAVVVDAGTHFVGASGGHWSVTCAAGADALQLDIDEMGRVTLAAVTLAGSAIVNVSYANSGGSSSAMFTVSAENVAPVAAPKYDGSLGDLSIASGEPVSIDAGFAFSGTELLFSASGLPAGVVADPATGRIAGLATEIGSYGVSVTATNPSGSAEGAFNLEIVEKPQSLPEAPSYDGSLQAQNAVLRSTFELSAGSAFTGENLTFAAIGLPPDLIINASSGGISGVLSSAGKFAITVTASNPGGTASGTFSLTVAEPALAAPAYDGSFQTTEIPRGVPFALNTGDAFTGDELAFSATGLAPGLAIDAAGQIAGTPTTEGIFATTITAKNSAGEATGSFQLVVAEPGSVTPAAPTYDGGAADLVLEPNTAMKPVNMSVHFTGADITYSDGGTLPTNLSVNARTGVISGTPNTGDHAAAITITGSNEGGSAAAEFDIVIGAGGGSPTASYTGGATDQTYTNGIAITPLDVTGWFSDGGATITSYAMSPVPSGLSFNTSTGILTGTPDTNATTSVTVTATNSVGTSSSGATFDITVQAAAASKSISPSYVSITKSTTSGTLAFHGTAGARRFVMVIAGARGMVDSGFTPASGSRSLIERQSWTNRVVELWEITGSSGNSFGFTVTSADSWVLAFETAGYTPDTTDPLVVGRQDSNNTSQTNVSATTKAGGASVAFSKRYDTLITPAGTFVNGTDDFNTGDSWVAARTSIYETETGSTNDYEGTTATSMGVKYVAVALFEEV